MVARPDATHTAAMRGRLVAGVWLLAFITASCRGIVGGTPAASAEATSTVPVPGSASAEPSASESQPSPSSSSLPATHPAAGLALVRPPEPGQIATHVYVVEPDGTLRQVTGLSRDSAGASTPEWSPDGRQLAFGPPKNGAGLLFDVGVVNADGTGERVLGQGANPHWSPDGTRLLFVEVDDVTSEPHSIYVADVAGGTVTEVARGDDARWLPDGTRIVFQRNVDGVVSAVIGPATGGEAIELAHDAAVAWSEGGDLLVVRDGAIWLADADGSHQRRLSAGFDPVWSPDGDLIAFSSGFSDEGVPLLSVMDATGSVRWENVPGARPSWSPDGSRLAVVDHQRTSVVVLDAATGASLWETEGSDPSWN